MKEYFLTQEEGIREGNMYEFWKIPSGGIVRWDNNYSHLERIYPEKRYGIVMGGEGSI